MVWGFAESAFLDQRDVVILEQRGNRYAEPSLDCDLSVWIQEEKGSTPCLDSLKERGIDLTHYTTKSIAADLNALMETLDYEQWNIYGTSYSTRPMQLVMRDHPERIRSAILQSVSRLDETRYEHDPEHAVRALEVMFGDCAADPECAAAFPDLEARFYTLFSRLNADPISFEVTLPAPDKRESVEIVDGYRLLNWMVTDSFYGPAHPPGITTYLPLLIDQVEKGRTELLRPWLELEYENSYSDLALLNWGLFFSVNCQDDAPSVTEEDRQRQIAVFPELEGYTRQARELEICALWELPAAPPLASEPIQSDIPTLVLAGSYDPITPPEWSKAVADNLANSYYYEFPASGHSVNHLNPCAERIKAAFLMDPFHEPDTSCLLNAPLPEFILPKDVIFIEDLNNSLFEVSLGSPEGDLVLEAIFSVCALFFLAEVLFLLIAGLFRIVKGQALIQAHDPVARLAHPLMGLVVLLNSGFFWGWSEFIYPKISNSFLLKFFSGISSEYTPVFLVPIFAFVLTLCLVWIAFIAWKRQYWSMFGRFFFSLVTLAAVGFAGFLIHWGVLTALF